MTQPSSEIPAADAAWYYCTASGQFGPLAQADLAGRLRAGLLGPQSLLWREGMPNWLPASATPEFHQAAARGARRIRTAKHNSIAMFVIFILMLMLSLIGTAAVTVTRGGQTDRISCVGPFSVLAAVYAAIYLPLRWRVMMALPQPSKTLGFIGGFGLVVLGVLLVVLLVLLRVAL